jgi:pimeloyl-ACP methyl ester carboxylesterase
MAIDFLSLAEGSLAYQRQVGDKEKPGVLFLGGYASDMEGTKAVFLAKQCMEYSIPFVRFDYSGCGQSPGSFRNGTIGGWLADSCAVFDQLTEGPQIVIGSSMGGWLGFLLSQTRQKRIKAYIGIAAAPDFTEELVWKKLTKIQKETLLRDGQIFEENAPPDHRIPMTLKLIEEARQHLLLSKPFSLSCPTRLLQGEEDKEVPASYAKRIYDLIKDEDKRLTLIKDGDHRLSTTENLSLLWQTVTEFFE